MDEIRPIWSEVDVLPGTHGSAIFTRGETQAINLVTLGSKMDQQTVDTALVKRSDTFMLHYNFPSFSVGEVRPIRGPGRREIGHGNLALRALKPMIPTGTDNPYTMSMIWLFTCWREMLSKFLSRPAVLGKKAFRAKIP